MALKLKTGTFQRLPLLFGLPVLLLIIAFPVKSLAGTSHSESRIGSLQAKVTVSGIVTDKNGSPLIGAGVFEKGTTNGTVTDNDGNPIPGVRVELVGTDESVITELDGTFSFQTDKTAEKVKVMYSGMQTKVQTFLRYVKD